MKADSSAVLLRNSLMDLVLLDAMQWTASVGLTELRLASVTLGQNLPKGN